jgi:hypothetical protein
MSYNISNRPNYSYPNDQSLYQPYAWRHRSLKQHLYPIPLNTPEGVPYKFTDDIWICWEFVPNPNKSTYAWGRDNFLCNSWISFDQGKTKHSGFYNHNFATLHPIESDKFLNAWEEVKKKRQMDIRKARNAEIESKLEKEAEKLGVDPQEYIKQKLLEQKKERQHKKEVSKVKRSVEETEKLMRLSKTLISIEAQLETLRQKISDEYSVVNLGYFNRNMEKLDVALMVLQCLNGSQKQ